MCVIFYQTKQQKDMTYDEFIKMATRNRDGMGYMALINGKVVYKKGYFDVDKFYEDYLALRRNDECTEIACHFRIGTGSNVDKANCHPFPITSNKSRLKRTQGNADVCIMMNGIIGSSTDELSDTALYVLSNLKPYYDSDNRFWLNFNTNQERLFENEISGTRFIFMSKEGSALFGRGWSDYEGKCQVSNRLWLPYDYDFDFSKPKSKTKNKNTYQFSDRYDNYYCTPQTKSKRFGSGRSYIDWLEDGVVS